MSKILVSMACAIILLHAIVPHHHHDCEEGGGLVFETELACHCDEACPHHDEHHGSHPHSHHPFDICLLQEMLSHLILTTNDDQHALLALIKADAHPVLDHCLPDSLCTLPASPFPIAVQYGPIMAVSIGLSPMLGTQSLRAPPLLG